MSSRIHTAVLRLAVLGGATLVGCSSTACRRSPAEALPTASIEGAGEPANASQEATEEELSVRLEEARQLHFAGVEGDDDAAEEALRQLAKLAENYPDHPTVLAYLGSARVLAARRTFLPWKKGETCKAGLELLERAVELAPESDEVRFLRAVSSHPLPAFFGRAEVAASDFAWLSERCDESLAAGRITPLMAATIHLYHGDCRQSRASTDDALQSWRAAVRIAPDSDPARLARLRLEEHAEEGA